MAFGDGVDAGNVLRFRVPRGEFGRVKACVDAVAKRQHRSPSSLLYHIVLSWLEANDPEYLATKEECDAPTQGSHTEGTEDAAGTEDAEDAASEEDAAGAEAEAGVA